MMITAGTAIKTLKVFKDLLLQFQTQIFMFRATFKPVFIAAYISVATEASCASERAVLVLKPIV